MTTEVQDVRKNISTTVLTSSVGSASIDSVPGVFDIIGSLQKRVKHDAVRASKIRTRLADLSEAYNEYVDLRRELEQRRSDIEKIRATLGPEHDKTVRELIDHCELDSEAWKPVTVLRSNLSLWEAMQHMLLAAGEARVVELQESLEALGIKASRQAIESALETHPSVFRTAKRGRDKYVSLKGA
jgi:hypothetical protein